MLARQFHVIFECPRAAVPPSPHLRALPTVLIEIAGEVHLGNLHGLRRLCVRSLWLVAIAFSTLFLQGCSSNSSFKQDPSITISVAPTAASVVAAKTQQFAATVTGTLLPKLIPPLPW